LSINGLAQYKAPVILNDPEYDVGKRLRFGFSIGLNTMDFTIKNSQSPENDTINGFRVNQYFAEVTHLIPGFNVNVVSDYRIAELLHVRFLPGYSFGQRNLDYYANIRGKDTIINRLKIESSFIELPLMLKYCARRHSNFRPYLILGGNVRVDLAASKKVTFEDDTKWYRLRKWDYYYEIGLGFDFFLTYFKFSTELKVSTGILNVMTKEYEGVKRYVDAIDRMNSQLFVLSFHFE
jgi:hypothetical protein